MHGKREMTITSKQAITLGLAGSDSWLYSHLRYLDTHHRERGAADLYLEAHFALMDTYAITHREVLRGEYFLMMRWFETLSKLEGKSTEKAPVCPYIGKRRRVINFENLKIASALEIFIKGVLLESGFVVHRINGKVSHHDCKELAKDQHFRPIAVGELLAACPFYFDEIMRQNYWPILKDETLNFSTVLMKDYLDVISLGSAERFFLEKYRKLRNEIHFPSQPMGIGMLMNDFLSDVDFLVRFANSHMAARFNSINVKQRMGYEPIQMIEWAP